MALFSSTSRAQQSNNLVSFRAGKMTMRGTMVHPDKRKGLVYVYQSDDSLMHFCWKDRTTGAVEDDLIVFPDDIEFLPVKQCTTGRVFLLKFKNSSRKLFFWMQEPKNDKDDEFCRKVNELLNNPPAPGSARTIGSRGTGGAGATPSGGQDVDFSVMNRLLNLGGSAGADGSGSEDRGVDIQNVLAGMDQQQLMQLLNFVGGGGSGALSGLGLDSPSLVSGASPAATANASGRSAAPSAGPPATASSSVAAATIPTPATTSARATVPSSATAAAESSASGASTKPIQVADLRNILSTLSGPGISASGSSKEDVDLEEVLTASNVETLATGKPEYLNRLLSHLPTESPVTADSVELKSTLHSPMFKQALGVFNMALQSGQLGPSMRQFGFSENAVKAVEKGDIQSIAEILEAETLEESGSNQPKQDDSDKKDKPDSKEDAMDLD